MAKEFVGHLLRKFSCVLTRVSFLKVFNIYSLEGSWYGLKYLWVTECWYVGRCDSGTSVLFGIVVEILVFE